MSDVVILVCLAMLFPIGAALGWYYAWLYQLERRLARLEAWHSQGQPKE